VNLYRNNRSLISQLTGTKTGDNVSRRGIVTRLSGARR
jgi:hypothetical protein